MGWVLFIYFFQVLARKGEVFVGYFQARVRAKFTLWKTVAQHFFPCNAPIQCNIVYLNHSKNQNMLFFLKWFITKVAFG